MVVGLMNADTGGAQQGSEVILNDVQVANGRFTVKLDYANDVFNGDKRWLEIRVRPGASTNLGDFVILNPRQEVTVTPYALQTRGIFADATGDVAVGTNEPVQDSPFTVYKDIANAARICISNPNVAGSSFLSFHDGIPQRVFLQYDNADAKFRIGTIGGEAMAFTSGCGVPDDRLTVLGNGDIGVGEDAENATVQLHVFQADAADAFRVVDEADDATPFFIDEEGKVHIGTDTTIFTHSMLSVERSDPLLSACVALSNPDSNGNTLINPGPKNWGRSPPARGRGCGEL